MNDFDVVTGPAPGLVPAAARAEAAKPDAPEERRAPASPRNPPAAERQTAKNEQP